MQREYPEKSYKLFWVWLFLFTAALVMFSLYQPQIAGLSTGKSLGIVMMVMLDLLFVIIYATQSVYWINGVTYEEAADAPEAARKRYASRQLVTFLAATAVYLLYCFASTAVWRPDMVRDSLAAGGILCIAAVTTIRISL